jgi:hypothetical protein
VSLANSADLQTAIAEWLYRTGDAALAARAADFITLFEADFVSDPEMRTVEMEEVDTATVEDVSISLPDGFLEMIRCRITAPSNQPLDYVTPYTAGIMDASAQVSANGFISKKFTILAERLFFAPQQSAPIGATIEMAYYNFTPLSASDGAVNWLLQKYPNIYLYGSLMQAAAYIDDKEMVAQWANGLSTATAKLAKSDAKRKQGAGPLAMSSSAQVPQ